MRFFKFNGIINDLSVYIKRTTGIFVFGKKLFIEGF
jgi:hypothetical protein